MLPINYNWFHTVWNGIQFVPSRNPIIIVYWTHRRPIPYYYPIYYTLNARILPSKIYLKSARFISLFSLLANNPKPFQNFSQLSKSIWNFIYEILLLNQCYYSVLGILLLIFAHQNTYIHSANQPTRTPIYFQPSSKTFESNKTSLRLNFVRSVNQHLSSILAPSEFSLPGFRCSIRSFAFRRRVFPSDQIKMLCIQRMPICPPCSPSLSLSLEVSPRNPRSGRAHDSPPPPPPPSRKSVRRPWRGWSGVELEGIGGREAE